MYTDLYRVYNFSHPITDDQVAQLRNLLKGDITVVDLRVHIDQNAKIIPQMREILRNADVAVSDLVDAYALVNPPGLSSATVALMKIVFADTGRLPEFIRMKPAGGLRNRFDVAEKL